MKGTLKDPLLTSPYHSNPSRPPPPSSLPTNFNKKSSNNFFLKRESSDESVKEGYFWATIDSTWTILDQKRLVSMDYLYHRSLEFHNNHHTFRATGDFDYTKGILFQSDNDLVCEILEFRNDR